MSAQLADLEHFTGSETWYTHKLFPSFHYTEGVRYVAQTASAYWLLDAIMSNQLKPALKNQQFQQWKLAVTARRGKLICDDGNGKVLHEQSILYTDFPETGVVIWLVDKVLLLPSEY